MDNLWQNASYLLQQELDPVVWQKWFNPDAVIKTEQRDSVYYICVSDVWVKTTLKLYLNLIEDALLSSAGKRLTPVLVDLSNEKLPAPEIQALSPLSMEITFNSRYTFDAFIVGASNRFAHAAAMAVAESPSRSYNPLFIYGGSGLGKTHLMHAIGQAALKKNPYKKVVYVSTETFTNEFIYMLRENRLESFKNRYRSTDILLIDDIQFLSNKNQTQEEFFHTFNALHEAGKQIVICSDRHPKELNTLEERLRNRFAWGLITDIQEPDWETRCAILQSKAISGNVPIDDEVVYLLADKIKANIRELEGALNKLMYYSELNQQSRIDMKLAQEALRELFLEDETPKLTINLIQRVVADYFQLSVEDLKCKRKDRDVTYPRQIAMYLCRDMIGSTTTQIGRDFGGRHHTTVMYACEIITSQRMKDTHLNHTLEELERLVKKK